MQSLFLAMLGGAVGSGARYLTYRMATSLLGPTFPWGTLTVNIFGGFLMGVLAGVLARTGGSEQWRVLIGVGMLGGFTTFSAFSLDVVTMAQRGALGMALGYALVSVSGAVLALIAGLYAVRVVA